MKFVIGGAILITLCVGQSALAGEDINVWEIRSVAAFRCAIYAEWIHDDPERSRLFSLGFQSGMKVMKALHEPGGLLLYGVPEGFESVNDKFQQSDEFVVGRVFQKSFANALKAEDGLGSMEQKAQDAYDRENCRLI